MVLDGAGGNAVALGSVDDKLIILKESACQYTSGDGPDNLGGGQFPQPEFISPVIGCNSAISVISHGNGLLFRSKKGWYSINRGLQLEYIGSKVDDYNDLTISSVRHIETLHHIRITHTDGSCLVYDYEFNEWAIYTNCKAVGSVFHDDLWHILKSTGVVWQETVGTFADPTNTEIVPEIETAWIKVQNLKGYQRIRRAAILGNFPTGYTYRVTEKVNFKETVVDTMDYAPADVNEVQTITFDAVPDTGAWTLGFEAETTSSLDYNANAAVIESALEALTGLNSVSVAGSYGSGFSVTFTGSDGGTDQELLTIDSNTLQSSGNNVDVEVSETTKGEAIEDDQFIAKLGVQKAEAIKLHITQVGSSIYSEWELTGFMFEVGLKKGTFKMRPSSVAS